MTVLKLLYICNEYPPAAAGGIGVLLRGLCEQLADRGHEVHVVGCYQIERPITELINGVRIHRLPGRFGRLGLLTDRIALYRAIAGIAAQGEIDIIEAPDFEAPSALLPRQSRKRVVRLHGSHVYFSHERDQVPSRSVGLLEKIALMQADAWISVSEYTARRTQEIFRLNRPINIVHNAANVPDRFPHKFDYAPRRRVVYFGTLAEKKGVLTLARSWKTFQESQPDWSLTLIGRDGLHQGRSVHQQMIELLGPVSASVEFLGPMGNDELLNRLVEFDFAVLPSFSETFALAPMEAMALGVPVIYSQLSSGPELMMHGVDGWLADPRDQKQLSGLLTAIADDPIMRARVAKAGQAKIKQFFSHKDYVEKNLQVYRQIFGKRESAV